MASSTTTTPEEDDAHDSDDEDQESELVHPSSASLSTKTWKDGHLVSEKGDDIDAVRYSNNFLCLSLPLPSTFIQEGKKSNACEIDS